MEFSRELLFFFSALGAFNGLLLGSYLLFIYQPRKLTNAFLGSMILMLSIRVGKSVFFYFNPDLALTYLQIGLTACFFVGPFLYLYCRSFKIDTAMLRKESRMHLGLLIPIILGVGMLYPMAYFDHLWRPYIIQGIYLQWLIYTLASAWVVQDSFLRVFVKRQESKPIDIWLVSLVIGNALLVAIYAFMDFTYYLGGALCFSFVLYLLVLFLFFSKKNRQFFHENHKYQDRPIAPEVAHDLGLRLQRIMEEEKLFRDPNLKIGQLAKRLKISSHLLSQFINENFGKNFSALVNEHRIKDACAMIKTDSNLTLEAIGYECGFNSRSTFYAAFRKAIGTTPAKYRAAEATPS
ncbi:MAG: helix-turn-helix domain-containing protein [Saprospiraceae bacterium]|nr:helix-turn-helix domain-containing protein [Saprospiraceae bacterium]